MDHKTILVGALSVMWIGATAVGPRPAEADEQNCIVAMNKAAEKVARAQGKENYRCVRAATKGAESAPAACLSADTSGRVQARRDKTVTTAAARCEPAPSFGYSSPAVVNDNAATEDAAVVFDVFGDDLDAALLGGIEPERARCQAAVVRAAEKILAAKLTTFRTCKKAGLAAGTIVDTTTLRSCFNAVASDGAGKISPAVAALETALSSKCEAVSVDAAFPGDCAGSGDFAACIERHIECRACRTLDSVDSLSEDCDLFDDAIANASCQTPPAPTTTTTTLGSTTTTTLAGALTYPIADTEQSSCYNNSSVIAAPSAAQAFYGQDAQYAGNQPSYTLSADGLTVHDNVSGLTWQRSPDTDGNGSLTYADKLLYSQALTRPATMNAANYGGYGDWRLPTLEELYSLILFSGAEASETSSVGAIPFINTDYFGFAYGFTSSGERVLDSQWVTTTLYVANPDQMFGVNFADGRIKGYPASDAVGKKYFVICVRSNPGYGANSFADNGDGTITDEATDLMWAQADSATGLNWSEALAWVQTRNAANYLGHNDWRLPNPKELHSIVDYTRSPDTTGSAAINPMFIVTTITNEAGQLDYPSYWTGTTLVGTGPSPYRRGVYVSFGRTLGYMNGSWIDVHGAGAQRAEFKDGDPADYPTGFGPQGDAIRIFNYVRCVRDAGA